MKKSIVFFLAIICIQFITSCVSDKPNVKPVNPGSISQGTGVYISNEGNFQWGNASISYLGFAENQVTEDIFSYANNRSLGDVCQSMTFFNGKIYIVVNNSGKIEIVNSETFKSEGTITGLTSPRYFLAVNSSKAYVTDLYANGISVIDLISNKKTAFIKCPGWTEELELLNNKVFVCNKQREYVYVINPSDDKLMDSIKVGYDSNSLRKDKNGKLWVLCGGRENENGSLYKINPENLTMEFSLTFNNGSGEKPWRLNTNGTGDTLFF